MRLFLVGVACVGKTTIGGLLAGRLGCSFFDLDAEIEAHFDTSIERLMARFLTGYSYRKECSVVLERIARENPDCVIALPSTGLSDAYLRVLKRYDRMVVVLEDEPENILARITFYDIDSKPIDKLLTAREKQLYLREIRADISYYRRPYRRADLHVDISGLDAEASAERVEGLILERRT